jgi:hypothetical protein
VLIERRSAIDHASRTYWPCAQPSGAAENVGVPGAKPGRPAGGLSSQNLLRQQVALVRGGRHRREPGVGVLPDRDLVLAALAALAGEQRPQPRSPKNRECPAMSGPYEAEYQATTEVLDVYAGYHKRGVMRGKTLDRLLRACSDYGLEVGSYDREVLGWIAGQKPETAQVIIDLIHRAAGPRER